MRRTIEVAFNINYIVDTLLDLCNRYRSPNTDPWLEPHVYELAGNIINSCIIDVSHITSSSMFDSYSDEIFKNGAYITIESLVKDYSIPHSVATTVVNNLIDETIGRLGEYGIGISQIGRCEQYNSSLHLLVHR